MNPWDSLDPGFLDPVWLGVGLLAVMAVFLLELGAERRRRQAVRLFAASHLLDCLAGTVSLPRRRTKQALLLAAVALLFVALARPHLFFRWSEETRSGLDVLLAVDCSKSMLTEDVRPNRLERAKLAVEDFADELPDNRLGLIAFAGDAFLECPLTIDHDAFQSAVRDLDTDTIPRPGTDIATAIDEAVLALKSQPNNLKFVILVTDGEDLEGRALDAARTAAKAGLKIYTVGVGTPEGGVIPEEDENGGGVSYLHDATGQIVTSRLDEETLGRIAAITGGAYVPLGPRGEGLENLYRRYIATLPKQQLEERREKVVFEQFEWPLALAILFLVAEFLIRERVDVPAAPTPGASRRKTVAPRSVAAAATRLLVAGLLLGAGAGPARAALSDAAQKDYQTGQYADAEQKYREALTAQPDRTDLQYDRGDAAYKAGEYDEAEEAFRKAMDTPDLRLQEDAYYNLGNTQFEHGEAMEKVDQKQTRALWEQALHSYESALKLREAADTRHNYDLVRRRLKELKQQQQQQNPNQPQQPGSRGQSQSNPSPGQGQNQSSRSPGQNPPGQPAPNNGQNPGQTPQEQGNSGQEKDAQPKADPNATAEQMARSSEREDDRQDPGIRSRQEAEALLDSLKDDEHRVTARALNGNNEPPPTASGKDW